MGVFQAGLLEILTVKQTLIGIVIGLTLALSGYGLFKSHQTQTYLFASTNVKTKKGTLLSRGELLDLLIREHLAKTKLASEEAAKESEKK